MAPESLFLGEYSERSDVWSYGVVLWEVFSYGARPYDECSDGEVLDMVRRRLVLPRPENCPPAVYTLMLSCWNEEVHQRPSFEEIDLFVERWRATEREFIEHLHRSRLTNSRLKAVEVDSPCGELGGDIPHLHQPVREDDGGGGTPNSGGSDRTTTTEISPVSANCPPSVYLPLLTSPFLGGRGGHVTTQYSPLIKPPTLHWSSPVGRTVYTPLSYNPRGGGVQRPSPFHVVSPPTTMIGHQTSDWQRQRRWQGLPTQNNSNIV